MKEKIVSVLVALVFGLHCFPAAVFAIAAPTNLSASQESPVSPRTIGLSWNKVSGAKGYVIYDNGSKVKDVGSAYVYHLEGVSVGKHKYTVKAYDNNNNFSEASNVAVVNVRPAATITKCSYEDGKVVLEWKAPTEGIPDGLTIARFEVLRKDSSNKVLAAYRSVPANKRSFTDSLVASSGEYEYAIGIRWSDNSYSALSATKTETIPAKTGTKVKTQGVLSKLKTIAIPTFQVTSPLTGALSGTSGLSIPKLGITKISIPAISTSISSSISSSIAKFIPKYSIASSIPSSLSQIKIPSLKGISVKSALSSGYKGIMNTLSLKQSGKSGNSLQEVINLGQGLYNRVKDYLN